MCAPPPDLCLHLTAHPPHQVCDPPTCAPDKTPPSKNPLPPWDPRPAPPTHLTNTPIRSVKRSTACLMLSKSPAPQRSTITCVVQRRAGPRGDHHSASWLCVILVAFDLFTSPFFPLPFPPSLPPSLQDQGVIKGMKVRENWEKNEKKTRGYFQNAGLTGRCSGDPGFQGGCRVQAGASGNQGARALVPGAQVLWDQVQGAEAVHPCTGYLCIMHPWNFSPAHCAPLELCTHASRTL